jgi:hypothetical protein
MYCARPRGPGGGVAGRAPVVELALRGLDVAPRLAFVANIDSIINDRAKATGDDKAAIIAARLPHPGAPSVSSWTWYPPLVR